MFDGMVKERSLSCDNAAAWKIQVIVRSGSISMGIGAFRLFVRHIGWHKVVQTLEDHCGVP